MSLPRRGVGGTQPCRPPRQAMNSTNETNIEQETLGTVQPAPSLPRRTHYLAGVSGRRALNDVVNDRRELRAGASEDREAEAAGFAPPQPHILDKGGHLPWAWASSARPGNTFRARPQKCACQAPALHLVLRSCYLVLCVLREPIVF